MGAVLSDCVLPSTIFDELRRTHSCWIDTTGRQHLSIAQDLKLNLLSWPHWAVETFVTSGYFPHNENSTT